MILDRELKLVKEGAMRPFEGGEWHGLLCAVVDRGLSSLSVTGSEYGPLSSSDQVQWCKGCRDGNGLEKHFCFNTNMKAGTEKLRAQYVACLGCQTLGGNSLTC